MITTVLLRGYLSEVVLNAAFVEIYTLASAGELECVLVIDSDGGDFLPAMWFVDKVKTLGTRFVLKVYNAASAAAFVFLSLRRTEKYAEMKNNTILGFHRGYLKLEAPDISYDGQVPEAKLLALRVYNAELEEALSRCGVNDPKLLAELHGTGWLNLSAVHCVELGLVNRLF